MTKHLLKPKVQKKTQAQIEISILVIKTAVKTKRPGLPSKRPFSSLYEIGKQTLRTFGYYEQYKQYDPGYHFERFSKKYTYKPRKRVAGYLGKALHESKTKTSYSKQYKTRSGCWNWHNFNKCN